MKKLIFVLFIALSACAEERIVHSFDSLEGWWNFSHKEASGVFEIVDYSGVLMTDNGPGNAFSIAGTQYLVKDKAKVIGSIKLEVFMVHDNQNAVSFYEVEFNKDYTELTAKYWVYRHNGGFKTINEPITITR